MIIASAVFILVGIVWFVFQHYLTKAISLPKPQGGQYTISTMEINGITYRSALSRIVNKCVFVNDYVVIIEYMVDGALYRSDAVVTKSKYDEVKIGDSFSVYYALHNPMKCRQMDDSMMSDLTSSFTSLKYFDYIGPVVFVLIGGGMLLSEYVPGLFNVDLISILVMVFTIIIVPVVVFYIIKVIRNTLKMAQDLTSQLNPGVGEILTSDGTVLIKVDAIVTDKKVDGNIFRLSFSYPKGSDAYNGEAEISSVEFNSSNIGDCFKILCDRENRHIWYREEAIKSATFR